MGRKIGSILSFVLIGLEIVSAIFLTPFLIRKFGQAEYGVYTLVISITSYLALLDLGIGHSVVKFVSSYKTNRQTEELNQFEGIITFFYIILSLITITIGSIIVIVFPNVFAKGLSFEEIILSRKLLIVTTINVAFTLGTAGFYYTVVGYENFFVSKGISIVFTVIRIIASFVALSIGGTSMSIVMINAIITIISRLIIVFYVLFKLKVRPTIKGVKKSQVKSVIFFSVFVFLQMVATQINSMADNVLIGIIVKDASLVLAVYGVGATLKSYLDTFGGAINGVLMPGVVRLVENNATGKDIENEMIRIGRIQFAFVGFIFCVFCVFGKQFITLWAGDAYADSYYVALILMFAYVIILTQSIGSQFLWAKNEHKEQAILKFIIVCVNIATTIGLMFWHPLYGAVLGTFISLMLGDVLVMQFIFKKKLKIKLLSYYIGIVKGLLPAMLIALCGGFLFRILGLNGWIGFVVNCLVMTLLYFVCLLTFGFSKHEKKFMRSLIFKGKKNEN